MLLSTQDPYLQCTHFTLRNSAWGSVPPVLPSVFLRTKSPLRNIAWGSEPPALLIISIPKLAVSQILSLRIRTSWKKDLMQFLTSPMIRSFFSSLVLVGSCLTFWMLRRSSWSVPLSYFSFSRGLRFQIISTLHFSLSLWLRQLRGTLIFYTWL